MCGRISLFAELGDLASQFRFDPGLIEDVYQPSWNVAPTASVLAITAEDGRRTGAVMRWGFTFTGRRSGSGSSGPLFNARSETLTERPAFGVAFARRRCLVPVNGFYEWRDESGVRTPWWIHRGDGYPFALAGIYNSRNHEAAACVITCAPNSLLEPIHNRMPVMLDAERWDDWLGPETDAATLHDLLQPREWPDHTARLVSQQVNRAGADGPQLVEPVDHASPRML